MLALFWNQFYHHITFIFILGIHLIILKLCGPLALSELGTWKTFPSVFLQFWKLKIKKNNNFMAPIFSLSGIVQSDVGHFGLRLCVSYLFCSDFQFRSFCSMSWEVFSFMSSNLIYYLLNFYISVFFNHKLFLVLCSFLEFLMDIISIHISFLFRFVL